MELTRASRDRDAWGMIPSWDGDPRTFTRFEVNVKWWLAGEDWSRVSSTVAARLVVRQTGAARARAELLEPVGLDGEDAVVEDGEVIAPGDPAAGVERVGLQGAPRPGGGRADGGGARAPPQEAAPPLRRTRWGLAREVQEPAAPGGRGAARAGAGLHFVGTLRAVRGPGAAPGHRHGRRLRLPGR